MPEKQLLAFVCCWCENWNRNNYLADSFHPEDGGDSFLLNVGLYKSHTACPRKQHSSQCGENLLHCLESNIVVIYFHAGSVRRVSKVNGKIFHAVKVLVELCSQYRLDLVGVQVRWEGSGTVPAWEYRFCTERLKGVESILILRGCMFPYYYWEFSCPNRG
jgi:hypothetical protein